MKCFCCDGWHSDRREVCPGVMAANRQEREAVQKRCEEVLREFDEVNAERRDEGQASKEGT